MSPTPFYFRVSFIISPKCQRISIKTLNQQATIRGDNKNTEEAKRTVGTTGSWGYTCEVCDTFIPCRSFICSHSHLSVSVKLSFLTSSLTNRSFCCLMSFYSSKGFGLDIVLWVTHLLVLTSYPISVCVIYCHVKTYCGSNSEIPQSPEWMSSSYLAYLWDNQKMDSQLSVSECFPTVLTITTGIFRPEVTNVWPRPDDPLLLFGGHDESCQQIPKHNLSRSGLET